MSTISEALRENKNEMYFLLELDFGDYIKRYATATVNVDNYHFEGKITNSFEVGNSFDVDSWKFMNIDPVINIINDKRLQDLEQHYRIDGAIGRIYLWTPGLTWSDIEDDGLLYAGICEKSYHTQAEYVIQLTNLASIKLETLTGQTITEDAFPNIRKVGSGIGIGEPLPFVFGQWSRGVPLYCLHIFTGGYTGYLAGYGPVVSVDGDYANGGTLCMYRGDTDTWLDGANVTFYPQAATSLGPIAWFSLNLDGQPYEPYHCAIKGLKDTSGIYTGTSGAMIQHPADIAYFLMDNLSDLESNQIGIADLRTMRSVLPTLKFASVINSTTGCQHILERLFSQCMCAMLQRGNQIGVMVFNPNMEAIGNLDGSHAIEDTIQISRTSMNQLCNNIRIQYKLNASQGTYEETVVKDFKNSAICDRSYKEYGRLPMKELELIDVHDDSTAEFLINRFLDVRAFRHDVIEWAMPYHLAWNYREGDIVNLTVSEGSSLDGNGWSDEPCILLEKRYSENYINQKWWKISV